jgi:predicted  nucleic acid-binding Zn-ribbon protein
MENLAQTLELLYELQKYDTTIEKHNADIKKAPELIKAKNAELVDKKEQTENKKKAFVDMSSLRKEKESALAQKEQAIDKRSVELNSVKSNDTYKAIILEIDKTKADKNIIEDEILELLMKIDQEAVLVKKAELELKEFEIKIKNDIAEIEKSAIASKQEIKNIEYLRNKHKSTIDSVVLSHYERVRQGNGGQGVCLVEGNACSVCGNMLRPQVVNQLQKGIDLVFCDGCSRILLKKY